MTGTVRRANRPRQPVQRALRQVATGVRQTRGGSQNGPLVHGRSAPARDFTRRARRRALCAPGRARRRGATAIVTHR